MATITDQLRHSLRHAVEHFSHVLPPQGPISTFIHHNTLHGFQHLHFHDAIAEASRILGGRGYLPNATYRALHVAGRITTADIDRALDEERGEGATLATVAGRKITTRDVERVHLVHGIEPLGPGQLGFELHERSASRRLRADVPEATRQRFLERAAAELSGSVERVGREWTVADWIHAHFDLDLPARLRAEVRTADTGRRRAARNEIGRAHV